MKVGLFAVHSQPYCTLKDVAGGYGTAFHIGDSLGARVLERAKSSIASFPSPTLAYLAAFAKAGGHALRVFDLHRTRGRHDDVPADLDLAVVLTSIVDAPAEREVLNELRRTGAHTIAVGAYASAKPAYFAECADAVVCSEPENLGAALFSRDVRGIVDAKFVKDLDHLPFPRWHDFPYADFRYAFLSLGTTMPIQSARGCAFACGYCPHRATAPFRERNPDGVIAEARHLIDAYDARALAFRDPLFNLDRDRVLALCKGIAPLGLRFSAEMRADRLDDELLATLHRAGLRSLELGVESIDTAMLRREKRKPPEITQIRRTVKKAHALGIRVIANYMFGLPDDTAEKIRATLQLAKELDTFAVQFTVATPYPGTTLAPRVKKRLRILDPSQHTGWEPTFDHPTLSAHEIRALREEAYVGYHFRPRYAARFLRSTISALAEEPQFALKRMFADRDPTQRVTILSSDS